MYTQNRDTSDHMAKGIKTWPLEYVLLLLAVALLLLGLLLFRILPDTVSVKNNEIPILSSLVTLGLAAAAAPESQIFDKWTGDVANIANLSSATTTITMPASNVSITATYKNIIT